MSRFHKGESVKIIAKEHQDYWDSNGVMDKYIGAIVEVIHTDYDGFHIRDFEEGTTWFFYDEDAIHLYEICGDDEIDDCNYEELMDMLM